MNFETDKAKKLNCWEYKKCGRESNGARVDEMGVCPVNIEERTNGLNGGKNAGRVCWAIAGGECDDKIQEALLDKVPYCIKCDFYDLVRREEGDNFIFINDALWKLR